MYAPARKLSRVNADLHPEYLSTKFAYSRQDELPLRGIHHHHAHVAACLAENQVSDRVIGISFDGTGYGLDGRIWGGEILIADLTDFRRACHFEYVPTPGGAWAIGSRRMAVTPARAGPTGAAAFL
jgi:hydrogenase maturation protein HypF